MSIYARLSPADTPSAGTALLQIRGWDYDNYGLQFAIQRNQDDYYLQHDRQWGNAPCWFEQSFEELGDDGSLSCLIGPDVLDPLLESASSAMFNFRLRSTDGDEEENPLKLLEGLLPSSASGDGVGNAQSTTRAAAPAAPPVAPPPPPAPEPEPEPEPEVVADSEPVAPPPPVPVPAPTAATPAKKGSGGLILIILLILLLLAGLGAGIWWWLQRDGQAAIEPKAAPAADVAIAQPAGPPAACSLEALADATELSFVQGCIQSNPDSDSLLAIIRQARDAGHCGVAQRLYANRSQAGDLVIARAYAREYDPAHHQPSQCFDSPDAATAAYWYETILTNAPDDAEARQRLEELQP